MRPQEQTILVLLTVAVLLASWALYAHKALPPDATVSAVLGRLLRVDPGVTVMVVGLVAGFLIHCWHAAGDP